MLINKCPIFNSSEVTTATTRKGPRGGDPPCTLLFYPHIEIGHDRLTTGQSNLRRPPLGLQYVMGIHCNAFTCSEVCGLVSQLKARTAVKVLVSGPGTLEPERYIKAGADAILIGEAEGRLIPIIDALTGRGTWDGLIGVHYQDGGDSVVETPRAPLLQDPDTLGLPHRPPELVPLYGEPVNPAQKGTSISVMASRGCPYRCTYCTSEELWDHKVRMRSVKHVLHELDAVLARWPDAYITFVDDIFSPNRDWTRDFCEAQLERRGRGHHPRFGWTCILHPKTYAGYRGEMLSLMARAGCNCICFGAQSSVPAILQGHPAGSRRARSARRGPAVLPRQRNPEHHHLHIRSARGDGADHRGEYPLGASSRA